MLGFLTPRPFRGDQVASGVVALTVLAGLLMLRLDDDLGAGARLAIVAVLFGFVTTLAWRSPTEASSPRGYQVALYVCSWALAALALVELVDVLEADLDEPGTEVWMLVALSGLAGTWSRIRDTATMTLLAATTATAAVLVGAQWLGDPGESANRWLLFGCAVVLALWALARRDRHPFHAAQLANGAGLAILAIFAVETVAVVFGAFGPGESIEPALGTGWELVGLAAGFGLVAYGAVDQHRGPVVIGVALLGLWVLTVGGDGGFLGWPLVLAAGSAFLLVVGLRPTTPMPPPPERLDEPAEPLPLPWLRRG